MYKKNELEKIKSIKSIDVYRNNYLQLEIDIIDREPLAFIRELNSYIDSSGVIIQKYNSSIDSIPEIEGILTDGEEFKILKVIAALENDNFFENKLKSISLKGDDIYLNITGFDFDIRFGNEFQLKNKLNMLKGFYIYQLNNSSNNLIGLKFAYKPNSFLMRNKPCSGLTLAEGSLSYLG